jgi:hypothetical protein
MAESDEAHEGSDELEDEEMSSRDAHADEESCV